MTTEARFDRQLPAVLEDLYVGPSPDYRDEVLAAATAKHQRPAWTFPGRWIPMADFAGRLSAPARLPIRSLAVALVIVALILAGALIYIGSRPRLPAPFGPAANGTVSFVANGDIYATDPSSGRTTAIVVGPETDVGPTYSLDGTHIAFERMVSGDSGQGWLYVARNDGHDLVRIAPQALDGLSGWSFSPDGRSVVAFTKGHHTQLAIVIMASDGTGQPTSFDVDATPDDGAPTYNEAGSEIMFIGRPAGAENRGIYALDPSSGKIRTIIAASTTADIHDAAWSPDGTKIAYGIFDPKSDVATSRTHVVSTDGTGDVAIATDPKMFADGGATWSNDGTRIIVNGFYHGDPGADDTIRSVILPIDRSSAGVVVGCPPGASQSDCTAGWQWSPDDSVLLGDPEIDGRSMPHLLANPSTGAIRAAPWTATGQASWQRVAR